MTWIFFSIGSHKAPSNRALKKAKHTSSSSSFMSSLCAKCAKPLVVEVHDDDDDDGDADEDLEVLSDAEGDIPMSTDDDGDGDEGATATVPDDVQLSCGDHFHWECLLESYEIETCPKCGRNITTPAAAAATAGSSSSATTTTTTTTGNSSDPQILVNLHNEGGFQSQIDIFPILQEESYLHAYPEERKSRAFLEFCKQGDHRAIADLIKSCNNNNNNPEEQQEENTSPPASHILRYQDPLNGMQSGLHAAVAHGHREVAWLLLLLASELPELEFPAVVYQEAATLEVMRGDQSGMVDIRSLKDARGRTAEDLAREVAGAAGGWGVWNGWIGNGRLAMLP